MSANTKMNPGDTVYSQHGQQAELVAASGGEYIVRPIYEDDDGEHAGEIETWRAAFRTPPAPKLDKDTAAAEKQLNEVLAQLSKARGELYELNKDEKARMERIKLHEELSDLDRYLAGEITHYVAVHDYSGAVEIIPIGDTLENYASSNYYGMLQLYPSTRWDKKVYWSVTYRQKSSYSGDSRTAKVWPCCGLEAAQAKVVELLTAALQAQLGLELNKRYYTDSLIANCKKYGVEVPQALVDGATQVKRATLEGQMAELKKKLDAFDVQLAALATVEGVTQ